MPTFRFLTNDERTGHYRQPGPDRHCQQHAEDTPLLCRIPGAQTQAQGISDKAIYLICQEIFQRAASQSQDEAAQPPAAGQHPLAAPYRRQPSAGCWHSLLMVSQNLRHASIQTTRRYLHSEEDARHQPPACTACRTGKPTRNHRRNPKQRASGQQLTIRPLPKTPVTRTIPPRFSGWNHEYKQRCAGMRHRLWHLKLHRRLAAPRR
jgi:hypothetical protein